jgi:hypothetical protein
MNTPSNRTTAVNISQAGTVYQMHMKCTPNNTGTEINCITDADILNKQVSFVDAFKHVPLLGGLLHAAIDISSYGTQMAESMMGVPIGSTEANVKSIVSNMTQPINLGANSNKSMNK